MGNFGVSDLVVVDPYEPVWKETRSAPGAESIVRQARRVGTWEEAVENISLVLATSSFHQRPMEHAVVELPNLGKYLAAAPASEPVALVFGSERSGLSNAELARCAAVVHVPTVPTVPSMNLAQAVAVVLYEWRRLGWKALEPPAPVPAQEFEALIQSVAALGEQVDYPQGAKASARLGRIRKAFQNAVLPASTVRFLLSFTRWCGKKIRS